MSEGLVKSQYLSSDVALVVVLPPSEEKVVNIDQLGSDYCPYSFFLLCDTLVMAFLEAIIHLSQVILHQIVKTSLEFSSLEL